MQKRIENNEIMIRHGDVLINKINTLIKLKNQSNVCDTEIRNETRKIYDYIIHNLNSLASLFPSEIFKLICTLLENHRKNNFLTEKKYDVIVQLVSVDEEICGMMKCNCEKQ